MELHDAIIVVLKEANRPLTCSEIAQKINARNLYERGDKKPLKSNQITARINSPSYQHLFEKDQTHTPMLISTVI